MKHRGCLKGGVAMLAQAKKTQIEQMLDYVDSNCPSDKLPLQDYEQAVRLIAKLYPRERQVLDTHLRQWQEFRARASDCDGVQPTLQSVAVELGCTAAAVSASLNRAHKRVFGAGRVCAWKFIQVHYMAMCYPRAAGIPYPRPFPFPSGLSGLERKVYRELCYGSDTHKTAMAIRRDEKVVSKHVSGVCKKLGQSRIEIALRFTASHCPDDLLPLAAYDEAVAKINLLDDRQRSILHEYLMQWREYLALPPSKRGKMPSLESVGAVVRLKPQTISLLFGAVADRLGIADDVVGNVRWCKFIRWYDMALRRAEMREPH